MISSRNEVVLFRKMTCLIRSSLTFCPITSPRRFIATLAGLMGVRRLNFRWDTSFTRSPASTGATKSAASRLCNLAQRRARGRFTVPRGGHGSLSLGPLQNLGLNSMTTTNTAIPSLRPRRRPALPSAWQTLTSDGAAKALLPGSAFVSTKGRLALVPAVRASPRWWLSAPAAPRCTRRPSM